ncbi:Abi family protein [Bifidobacterium sp. ESL0769]|uniref:Abi family protein n=1 Tax=Bifidobacterium sp. ESL0769 TaxID=2983229 RepID=UPI0023F6DF5F|nr:Abi family protein [Bifidobacterium sp. ESL0769]WEV67358.1 Abi family protein [Bifidobacterium sp. ESL0769]
MEKAGLPNLPDYGPKAWPAALASFLHSYSRSQLPYIRHFRKTYSNPLPPYWMLAGCLDYGALKLFLYQGAPKHIKNELACRLGIPSSNPQTSTRGDVKRLDQWLETIRCVRNMTAHHDRLWNSRSNLIAPKLPDRSPAQTYRGDWWGHAWDFLRDRQGPAAFLTVENYLLKQIEGTSAWQDKFIKLMGDNPHIPITQMGFPPDWQDQNLWK